MITIQDKKAQTGFKQGDLVINKATKNVYLLGRDEQDTRQPGRRFYYVTLRGMAINCPHVSTSVGTFDDEYVLFDGVVTLENK